MSEFWSEFLIWCFVGVAAFGVTISNYFTLTPNEKSLYWRPGGADARKTILRRARLALSSANWLHTYFLFLPVLVFLGLFVAAATRVELTQFHWNGVMIVVGVLTGYATAFGIGYVAGLGKRLRKFRLGVAQIGAKMVARLGDPEEAVKLLRASAGRKQPLIRQASLAGFKELGSLEHLDVLERLSQDTDPDIKAAAVETVLALQKLLTVGAMSLQQMNALISDHKNLDRLRKPGEQISSNTDYDALFEKTCKRIDEMVYSQVKLRHAFPNLYCKACYAPAERQTYADWDWVRCVQCKDALHLVADVSHVTGQIGGADDWALQNGHLRVSLWDDRSHLARNATMEVLEIVGGKAIDYDWAVSALVVKLENENPAFGKSIRVHLVNAPALSLNSLHLLRNLDPEFRADGVV